MATQTRYIAELADGTRLFYSREHCIGIQSPHLTGHDKPIWTNYQWDSVTSKHKAAFVEEHGGQVISGNKFNELFKAVGVMDRDVATIVEEDRKLREEHATMVKHIKEWQAWITNKEEEYKRKSLNLTETFKQRQAKLELDYQRILAEAERTLELALEMSIA